MKKIIVTTAIILFSIISAKACDICGCGLGNYYLGMMPQFSHKFFGVRYQFRNFHTIIANDPTQFSHDYYKTIELWGGWNIGKRWQVIALLPYNFVHQVSDDGISNNQGLGDVAVLLNYKVFDKTASAMSSKVISQQLWFGGGIKAPTGRFNIDATDPELIAIANKQTGTASTDFMLNSMYNVRIDKFGVNTAASYKINTTNKDKYTFGNKFSVNTIAYYVLRKNAVGFMPNIGMSYENTASNTLDKVKVDQTGGHLLATSAGVEISYKRITLGANMQLPLSQNFASGQTEMKVKGMMHVTFSL
jgi:hypothetical protein